MAAAQALKTVAAQAQWIAVAKELETAATQEQVWS